MRKQHQNQSEPNLRQYTQQEGVPFPSSYYETLELFKQSSMNLPMKDHENKLHMMLEALLMQLDVGEKEIKMLRQSLMHTQYEQSSQHNDLSEQIVQDLAEVTVAFRKMCEKDQQDREVIQKQFDQLKQEKNKLQQQANILEHKIGENEKFLGIGKEATIFVQKS